MNASVPLRRLSLPLFCSAVIFGAIRGDAAESVGMIVAIRGQAEAVSPDNVSRALKMKSPIFRGDTLKTGARGRLQMSFLDETVISLGRSTEMTIEEFEYAADKSDGKLVTRVEQGVFRVMGGAIAKIAPDNFRTVTPTATIGIRGSFYLGTLFDQILTAVFLGGTGITVSNMEGAIAITQVSFGTVVNPGSLRRIPAVFRMQR